MLSYTKIGLSVTVLLALAATAYATNTAQNDAKSIELAKVSMTQAIAVAEQAGRGKASHAEYLKTVSGWAYDVEVVSDAKVFDIRVDADKGTVLSFAEDRVDLDDGTDRAD